MKSLFVVSDSRVNDHVGETYDEVVEVVREPTTESIEAYARKIEATIRRLWEEDSGDRKVVVGLDAASPFAAILIDLRVILGERDGIVVELPWYEPDDISSLDEESREVLAKLENK